jgi:hypothetical protein
MRLKSVRYLIIVGALLAFALPACGGEASSSATGSVASSPAATIPAAQTIMAATQKVQSHFTSFAADFSISVSPAAATTSPSSQPLAGTASGSAVITGQAQVGVDPQMIDMTATVTATGAADQAIAVRLVDGVSYVQSGGVWYRLPKVPAATTAGGTKSLQTLMDAAGISQDDWLVDPGVRGIETVGGQTAYHLTAGIDPARLMADVVKLMKSPGYQELLPADQAQALTNADFSETQAAALAAMMQDAHWDFWVATATQAPVRFSIGARLVPSAGMTSGDPQDIKATITYSAIGQPVAVSAPQGARPWSESPAVKAQKAEQATTISHTYEESGVMEGLHTIQVAIQSWQVDHNDKAPAARLVTEAGLGGYADDWPQNPYTGGPMTPGKGPGQYVYRIRPGTGYYSLTGYGPGGKAILTVP